MRFLVVAVALFVACSHGDAKPRKLTPHALPGFSISLPTGKVIEDNSSQYADGSYGFGIKGSWAVMIEWRGAPVSKSDYSSYAEAWKLDYGKPLAIAPPNMNAETYAGTNHGPARLSFITCGTRYVVIGTIDRTDVDRLHRDVLATFTCTPDAAKEKRAAVRIALASPTGWTRTGDDDPRVLLLSRNAGAQAFLGLYYASEPSQNELERLVRRYQGTVGPGDPHPITAAGARGWLRVLRCGSNYVVAAYIEQGSGAGAADRTTIDGARCLRDGEPDVVWPK